MCREASATGLDGDLQPVVSGASRRLTGAVLGRLVVAAEVVGVWCVANAALVGSLCVTCGAAARVAVVDSWTSSRQLCGRPAPTVPVFSFVGHAGGDAYHHSLALRGARPSRGAACPRWWHLRVAASEGLSSWWTRPRGGVAGLVGRTTRHHPPPRSRRRRHRRARPHPPPSEPVPEGAATRPHGERTKTVAVRLTADEHAAWTAAAIADGHGQIGRGVRHSPIT